MGDNIPVPAETVRRMVESATEEVRNARDRGHHATARSIERAVSSATEEIPGKDGEFVSVPASHVSTLAAHGSSKSVPESSRHTDCARVYLEQYGVW